MGEKWNSYIDMFNLTAGKCPERTAIIHGDRRVSYCELARASDVIAGALIERSVQKGQIVPVVLKRSPEAFAAMLGIWKTGAAGTFINTAYPAERIEEICRLCGSGFVLDEAWIQKLDLLTSDVQVHPEFPRLDREDLAMVVFTSGSSGSPKGVMLPHRAIAHRTTAMGNYFLKIIGFIPEKEKWLSIVPLSSVIIIADEFALFIVGGMVDLVPDEIKQDITRLIGYGIAHGITHTFVPPILGPLFLKHFESQMKVIATGSERVSNLFSERVTVINGYGSSETTGTYMVFTVDRHYENTPIGKPHEGTDVYLLDSEGHPVPQGEIGEICVSGDAVAQGYLNRGEFEHLKELNAKKFIPNPFSNDPKHKTLYRSGDLARLNAEGNYEYVQRTDWMLKVAGNRVEPGEIEYAICKVAPVSKAVVIGFESRTGETAHTRLYACFTANEKLDPRQIQEALGKILPVYMIPAFIEQVPSLPLNLNGKIDRSKIVPPEIEYYKSDYEEPANEMEKIIARGFQEALGIPRVGALDNFLLLGGDSISAAKLALTLHKETGISVVDILLQQTPRALAAVSAAKVKERESWVVIPEEAGPVSAVELTPYQATFYNEWLLDPGRYDYNIVEEKIFEGALSTEKLNSALRRFINDIYILNSCISADGDKLYWKRREPLPDNAQVVQYYENNLGDNELFFLLTKPFDLKNDRMIRYYLIKLSDTRYRFFSVTHHILTDGTKGNAVYEEFARYYNDPGYTYTPDAEKQKSLCNILAKKLQKLTDKNREGINAFWHDYSRGASPVDLKFLQGSLNKQDETIVPVNSCRFSIDQKELNRVKIISQKFGITPFIYSELVFALLLHRMSGQNSVSFSYPVTLPEGDCIFYGSQVNTLFVNFSFDKETTLIDLIRQAKNYYYEVESRKAKYLPVNEIAGYLDDKGVLQISFAQTNMRETSFSFEGITNETTSDQFHFDNINILQIQLEEKNEQLNFKFKYKNRILDPGLVQNFANRYQRLLAEIADGLLKEM